MQQEDLERILGGRSLFWETVADGWFRGAVAVGGIAVCEIVEIPEGVQPSTAMLAGVFSVAAVAVGKKARANFQERRAQIESLQISE
ncbi:MAG TPA: hypothetical protein VHC21_00460 [Candidatus Saccharimonadales bacterium]|nr:hypothetical protein [Candidatus Saccharimonadales bacterium]